MHFVLMCSKGKEAICLADYCDIFRCDVVSGKLRPHFWDVALCKEAEMKRLMDRCQVVQRLQFLHSHATFIRQKPEVAIR